MKYLECKSCGASLVIDPSGTNAHCPYCRSRYVLDHSDTDYYRAMKANETLNESLNYLGENAKDESPYSLFITTKGDFEITLSATLTKGNAKAVFDSRDPNADGQYCYWEDNEGNTHYFGFYKDEVSVPYHKQALPDGRVAYKFDIIMPIREYYPDGTSARSAIRPRYRRKLCV